MSETSVSSNYFVPSATFTHYLFFCTFSNSTHSYRHSQVRRSLRLQGISGNSCQSRSTDYQQWRANLLLDPSSSSECWLHLPIATSNLVRMHIPDMDSPTTLQNHNTLIYHLTSSNRPTLPTFYVHDPIDPCPPLVFDSNNPTWVENQARIYALSRCRDKPSTVVGIYLEHANTSYMIALFHLASHLFLPLPERIPLSITRTLCSSVQLSGGHFRISLLLQLILGTSPYIRYSTVCNEIEEFLDRLNNESRFFDTLDDEGRKLYFEEMDYYTDKMTTHMRSLRDNGN